MNELVEPDRGILIRVKHKEKKDRSMLNYIDVTDLEEKLNGVFAMSYQKRLGLGNNARAWYDAQNAQFGKSLQKFLNELN
jgi:hypothetical protein